MENNKGWTHFAWIFLLPFYGQKFYSIFWTCLCYTELIFWTFFAYVFIRYATSIPPYMFWVMWFYTTIKPPQCVHHNYIIYHYDNIWCSSLWLFLVMHVVETLIIHRWHTDDTLFAVDGLMTFWWLANNPPLN